MPPAGPNRVNTFDLALKLTYESTINRATKEIFSADHKTEWPAFKKCNFVGRLTVST